MIFGTFEKLTVIQRFYAENYLNGDRLPH